MSKLLSALPVGALVKDPDTKYNGESIIFRVLEHGHSGDPSGTTALECRDIISLKCFDAKEPNNSDSNRKSYGNNRYLYSNLLQWLNSEAAANAWYTAKHTADQKPDSSNVWAQSGTPINPYDTEAGFLANFSAGLKTALQASSKVTAKNTVTDGGSYETVNSKIFLLSNTEVGLANENSVAEGSIYAYYSADNQNSRRVKKIANAAACGNYTGTSAGAAWSWWLRTPYASNSGTARSVHTDGSLSHSSAFRGNIGVSPAFCVLSSLTVSDSPDASGVYSIEWNKAPTITTASDSLGDKNTAFSLDFVINDADGDAVSADVKLDGTTKQTIASVTLGGTNTFNVDNTMFRALSAGAHTIQIVATDSKSASTTKNVTFQRVVSTVTIDGTDRDLGNKWIQPSITYRIADSNNTQVDVVEKIDGTTTKTRTNVSLNTDLTFDLSSFSSLSSEANHTLTIEATNEDAQTATRTYTFTKLWGELSFYTNAVPTDAAAKRINIVMDYEKTGDPTVRVEVTNNACAIQATWEDATEEIMDGEAYEFENIPTASSEYGIAIRVTITKNANTERVYINSLGFSFA